MVAAQTLSLPTKKYVFVDAAQFKRVRLQRTLPKGTQHLEIFNLEFTPRLAAMQKPTGPVDFRYVPPALWPAPNDSIRFMRPDDRVLIALAVLPNKESGTLEWSKVDRQSLPAEAILGLPDLRQQTEHRIVAYKRSSDLNNNITRRFDLQPVLFDGTHYYTTPNLTVTECFVVTQFATRLPFDSDNVTLNLGATPFPQRQLWTHESKMSDYFGSKPRDLAYLMRSCIVLERQSAADYHFSTVPTGYSHPPLGFSGAEDFIYRPGTGLVAAKYGEYVWPVSEHQHKFFEQVPPASSKYSTKRSQK
ncbi:hypothetical protein ASU33_11065 [Solirubrum puertoriconensis]|uniref:Uncharacterized protein n=1 Tax=Solirubrum puertoriconensis TaxID=1751427 RepID=A0A9X0HMG6_SOLP1|nr:hypothetical protein ASU33_11065 [Solirubrum puertoriconensis]